MIEAEGEIVDPMSDDEQIREVLSQFAAAHESVSAKPAGKRGPAKKKTEVPVPAESEVEFERELEPGESLPGAVFDGMGSDDSEEDDAPDGLPIVHKKPKPDAGQKDDVWAWYEKFRIGSDPEMDIQLVRVYPKIFPNGVIAEGPLDTFPTPVDEAYIASTYGGGKYEIYAMGPGKGGHGRRRFSRFTINIPGVANSSKPSSLVRDAAGKGDMRMQGPVAPPQPPSENVGVVQQALKTLEKSGEDAQKRAKSLEDRFFAGAANSTTDAAKLTDIVREEADKRVQMLHDQSAREIRLVQEKSEREVQMLRDLAERDSRQIEDRLRDRDQKISELRDEVGKMQNATPSMFKEMAEILRPQQQGNGNGMSQEMMNSILTKHAAEIEAMRAGHAREVEATRAAHLREVESMRHSQDREREGDRREAAAREQRVVDQLEQSREERRRDQEMHKQLQEQRETSSRDREQSRVDLVDTMWQARIRSSEEASNFRISSLSAEMERLRGELSELRGKAREDGDVYAQIERAKQLLDVARDGAGGGLGDTDHSPPPPQPPPQPAPKGIIEQAIEYGPMIGKIVTDIVSSDAMGGKKKKRQQQQPPMGSVINTPQGRMVVTPQGLVPEYLYAQTVNNQQSQQMRMFQQPQPQPQPQPPPPQRVQMQQRPPQEQQRQQQRQRPPQEQRPPQRQRQPQEQQRQPQVRRTSRPQDELAEQQDAGASSADHVVVAPNIYEAQEQMAGAKEPITGTMASFVAKALDDGLNAAVEVDEFIDMVKEKVPETYLQDLVKYTANEILASIKEHAPKSLSLSPGGVEFTVAVMRRLRAMYGIT